MGVDIINNMEFWSFLSGLKHDLDSFVVSTSVWENLPAAFSEQHCHNPEGCCVRNNACTTDYALAYSNLVGDFLIVRG